MEMTRNFWAHLSSDQKVPPVESMATDQAIFHLCKDGETLGYKLIVANIKDVRMAHIHMAPAGSNAGVVVWLYSGGTISGATNGILAMGEITSADLVGPLAGMALEDLIDVMKADSTYVNVHTDMYPNGEICDQISGGKLADTAYDCRASQAVGGLCFFEAGRVCQFLIDCAWISLSFFELMLPCSCLTAERLKN